MSFEHNGSNIDKTPPKSIVTSKEKSSESSSSDEPFMVLDFDSDEMVLTIEYDNPDPPPEIKDIVELHRQNQQNLNKIIEEQNKNEEQESKEDLKKRRDVEQHLEEVQEVRQHPEEGRMIGYIVKRVCDGFCFVGLKIKNAFCFCIRSICNTCRFLVNKTCGNAQTHNRPLNIPQASLFGDGISSHVSQLQLLRDNMDEELYR